MNLFVFHGRIESEEKLQKLHVSEPPSCSENSSKGSKDMQRRHFGYPGYLPNMYLACVGSGFSWCPTIMAVSGI